jgi:hypothetical protein
MGVFDGGKAIASNIFYAWINSGPKNLECNVFVDPQSHKILLLRGQTYIGWPQNIEVLLKIGRGTLFHHFKTKFMGVGRNGGLLDPLSRFVTPTGALFPRNFFQRV